MKEPGAFPQLRTAAPVARPLGASTGAGIGSLGAGAAPFLGRFEARDELATWRDPSTFDMLQLGLHLKHQMTSFVADLDRVRGLARQVRQFGLGDDRVARRARAVRGVVRLVPKGGGACRG
jgi:hypothetical protein